MPKTTTGNGSSKQQAPPSAGMSRAELEDLVKGAVSDALQDVFNGQHEEKEAVPEEEVDWAAIAEAFGRTAESFFKNDLKKTEAKYDLIKSLAKTNDGENIEFKITVEI